VNGVPTPLLFASDSQVNFQCPLLSPETAMELILESSAIVTSPIETTMQAAAPGLFTSGAERQGTILIGSSEEIAMPAGMQRSGRPARPGEYVRIYATGLGAIADGIQAGTQAPLDRPISLINPVKVIIGDVELDAIFAGLAPGTAGVFQVVVALPAEVPTGPDIPLYLKVLLPDGQSIMSNEATLAIDAGAAQ